MVKKDSVTKEKTVEKRGLQILKLRARLDPMRLFTLAHTP